MEHSEDGGRQRILRRCRCLPRLATSRCRGHQCDRGGRGCGGFLELVGEGEGRLWDGDVSARMSAAEIDECYLRHHDGLWSFLPRGFALLRGIVLL